MWICTRWLRDRLRTSDVALHFVDHESQVSVDGYKHYVDYGISRVFDLRFRCVLHGSVAYYVIYAP